MKQKQYKCYIKHDVTTVVDITSIRIELVTVFK